MFVMNTFGTALARRREALGLSQREASDAAGRDRAWWSRAEGGQLKETPTPEVLSGIGNALGLTQAELLRTLGYEVGEPDDAEVVTVRADDPRAVILRIMQELPDSAVHDWIVVLQTLTHAAEIADADVP